MLVEYSNIDGNDAMILVTIHRGENWGIGKNVEMMKVLLSNRMDLGISGIS
jgi:UDP-N-acetylglucosamine 2-epimerase